MVLATIIRLEMAYPGVGILAGDSLQYLSVVTAHAVIMVFFMIMPLLFGAFGNFLLPTQLGVHDVAFPRLNSAAFWFLPAGLLMLVQLVCLDRRYQRMNCYNIREIQTILKSKYSPNSSDSSDIRFTLNDTILGLRFNRGGLDFVDPGMLSFYRNNLSLTARYKALQELMDKPISEFNTSKVLIAKTSAMFTSLSSRTLGTDVATTLPTTNLMGLITTSPILFSGNTVLSNVATSQLSLGLLPTPTNLSSGLTPFAPVVYQLAETFTSGLTSFGETVQGLRLPSFQRWAQIATSAFSTPVMNEFSTLPLTTSVLNLINPLNAYLTPTSDVNHTSALFASNPTRSTQVTTGLELNESSSETRFARFMNPVFKYDFKVGNYMPDDAKKINTHLFATLKDLTTGLRKSS